MEVLHGEIFLSSIPRQGTLVYNIDWDAGGSTTYTFNFTTTYPQRINSIKTLDVLFDDGLVTFTGGTKVEKNNSGVVTDSKNISTVTSITYASKRDNNLWINGYVRGSYTDSTTLDITLYSGEDYPDMDMHTVSVSI